MKLKGMCNGQLNGNCVSNAMRLNEVPHEAVYNGIVKHVDDLTHACCLA
jgi:hypothetical protein